MSQPSAIPKSMSAIAIEGGVGPARALKLVSIKTPTPKSGEVLIRVAAAGNNYPDIFQREGRYPLPPGTPATLGLEISGTVAVVGADVQRFRVGDPVCALLLGGGYAEYAAVDAHHVLPVPTGVNVLEAAALSETFFTVYANVFERGALKAGETLLVRGGTSGIGTRAISMAKAAGARVIATSRSAEKGASSEDARSRRVDRLEPAGLPGGRSGRGRRRRDIGHGRRRVRSKESRCPQARWPAVSDSLPVRMAMVRFGTRRRPSRQGLSARGRCRRSRLPRIRWSSRQRWFCRFWRQRCKIRGVRKNNRDVLDREKISKERSRGVFRTWVK